jgi:hypothetical protein
MYLGVGMTTEPTTHDSKDDQELANALAGISSAPAPDALHFEETPSQSGAVSGSPFGPAPAAQEPVTDPVPAPSLPTPTTVVDEPQVTASSDPALEGIKKDALNELRPLVGKLNVSPEEKFDTYLLLLRSTDDTSLIGPAHDAAKEITDEARRAQALLDVIKEIDYLSQNK